MRKALLLSVVLHLAVLPAFVLKKSTSSPRTPPSQALSTRVLSEKDFLKETKATTPKSAQVVQVDDRLKTKLDPSETQDIFLGRHNQRVDQNTRAARVGKFKNVLKEGVQDARDLFKLSEAPSPQEKARAQKAVAHDTHAPASPPAEDDKHGKTTRFPASVPGADPMAPGEGFSATDDYLPHAAIGANTLLNTREYKYASFFERIREKLNHQWQTKLRAELENLYLQGMKGFSGERLTKLKVFLDANGAIVKITKQGSAGYLELDRAAVEAFRSAAPFPNPPKDLLEGSTPTVSIDWHFVVVGNEDMGFRMRVDRVPAGFR
jgi:protein TonB